MPRELVCLQVGQCGNQVGCKFWDLALQEHLKWRGDGTKRAPDQKKLKIDDAMSSFFYSEQDDEVTVDKVKARAVPIDMEEGVLNGLLKGNLKTLFDRQQMIANQSGCGNNWAVGHEVYGTECGPEVMEKVRKHTENCDSLQTFLLLHSLGGGTGSGFGTRLLTELEDEYPSTYRFVSAVFPQRNDDVITSPYNSILSLSKLIDHADCVIPVDNSQLSEIVDISKSPQRNKFSRAYGISEPSVVQAKSKSDRKGGEAFESMNYIVASMLTHLTASMRFPGSLNVDLNEITTNLVPFPRLHFLHSSVAPIVVSKLSTSSGTRRVGELFRDTFDRRCQLLSTGTVKPTYFASCMLLRGDVTLSDATANIEKLRKNLSLPSWNTEGFKVGMCSVPACEIPTSLLSLTNTTSITHSIQAIKDSFVKLYSVGAHLHHYTEYIEQEEITEAYENVNSLVDAYHDAANIKLPFSKDDVHGSKLLF
eukprot:TRINITY_DN11472_c0_g1_i1.p1 TRINITY_DN11472_c0_g1~~TRINITY_DN11472_c0_g1_i1.p1  ORF type:complete len:496 (+),score=56.79 TRINITY_DN11472_c0_g1_i1:56-1489(+)